MRENVTKDTSRQELLAMMGSAGAVPSGDGERNWRCF
jgi:hypothetical protein